MIRTAIIMLCLVAATACAQPPTNENSSDVDKSIKPASQTSSGDDWMQWGGPNGDFQLASRELQDTWPAEGPEVLWNRDLGDGYSTVAATAGRLYTMYRDGDDEIAIALDAETGETVWEYRYAAPALESQTVQFGRGPNATPLVLDDQIITLGYTGKLNAISRQDGTMIWSHDLVEEFQGEVLGFGNSASPILHDGRLIVLAGGERQAVMALDPATGAEVWSSPAGSVSYATPIVIDVNGQEQIVYFSADAINGLDAATGKFLWTHPCVNQYENNATGPLWGKGNLLWVATQLDGGTRVLRLSRDGDATNVEEVWNSNKISYHFWNALLIGDNVYASIGGQGSILAAVDLASGEILWRERGFDQVNFLQAGDRTIMLDSKGWLALASLSPEGIEVQSKVQISEETTWVTPTLIDSTLYVRDKKTLRAFKI